MDKADESEIKRMLSDIRSDPKVLEMKEYRQHGNVTTYEHCKNVTRLSYYLNIKFHLKADNETLVKGAMLHDFYLYDWHEKDNGTHDWHGFIHADRALKNAERYLNVSKEVKDVISSHMWPLNIRKMPRSREAWIVCFADKCVSLYESVFMR
ncbi:MAG: HD domain-containing protein [Lachnospiraceae bacterium]|nr:HD domain-containing protein [Lachnospiraceae bacterium]